MNIKMDEPIQQPMFLIKMIEFLGDDGLFQYHEMQTESVKLQEQVFLLREFNQDGTVTVHRIFPEEPVGEQFKTKLEALVAIGKPEVAQFQFEYGPITYDQFAELETREGVKQYFWFENT